MDSHDVRNLYLLCEIDRCIQTMMIKYIKNTSIKKIVYEKSNSCWKSIFKYLLFVFVYRRINYFSSEKNFSIIRYKQCKIGFAICDYIYFLSFYRNLIMYLML